MAEQDMRIEELEQFVRHMPWKTVSLEPDEAEIRMIEEQIPLTWVEVLDTLEQEIEREVLEPLYAMDINELNAVLDIPDGDIVANARESLDSFELDVEVIMKEVQEIDITIEQEISIEHDDFGR